MPKSLLSLCLTLIFGFSCVSIALPQDSYLTLTNNDILTLVRAKIPSERIIEKINNSSCNFDTFPPVLDELRYRGVPDEVLAAMIKAPHGDRSARRDTTKAAAAEKTLELRSSSGPKELTNTSAPEHSAMPTTSQSNGGGVARRSPDLATRKEETVDNTTRASVTEVRSTTTISENTLPVTGDLAEEISLGLSQRNSLLSRYAVINRGPFFDMAQGVFARLHSTAAFQGVPNLPYDVTVIQSDDLNAYTIMGGHLFVTSKLAALMGNDAGLWASVEGHEMAHSIYRHAYKKYFRDVTLQRQLEYYRYRIALGDQSANWALLAAAVAGKLVNKKQERNDENEADKLGLLMMVEAGYHPDYAIELFQIFKRRLGDESKFGALFSGHPRFTTREERMRELYPEALSRFRSLWPDVVSSPGGPPPVIVSISKMSTKSDKLNKTASLQFSYTIHNAKNHDLAAAFLFTFKGQSVRSNDPAFQAKDGSLLAMRHLAAVSDDESAQAEVTVPTAAVAIPQHKLKARACLLSESQVIECSKEFDVSFPNN